MGCGASKRTTVVPVEEATGGGGSETLNKVRHASEVIAVQGDDLPAEILKDGPEKVIGQAMAFEVPVNEESLIRKHPPKRLQRLEDQQVLLTHELLDEKQAEAEQRRNQILTQRVQSARKHIPRRPILEGNDLNEDIIETMKSENSTLEL